MNYHMFGGILIGLALFCLIFFVYAVCRASSIADQAAEAERAYLDNLKAEAERKDKSSNEA